MESLNEQIKIDNLHYQFSRFKDDPVVFEILAGGFFKNKKIKNDCYNESYNAILNYLARLDDVSYNNILEKITQTNEGFSVYHKFSSGLYRKFIPGFY